MALICQFESQILEREEFTGAISFSALSSDQTVLVEMPPYTIDEYLFCHRFQTDQLLTVQGSLVVVCLQNRQYHYIPMSDLIPQVLKIPPGIPHLAANLSAQPCRLINAIIHHGKFHSKDYQTIKKPFPLDLDRIQKLFQELQLNKEELYA
ncbi:MAG: cupin domain-containing protein [Nostocaceae cyanobacterium]|nr:cupin domain-containing protein [Nostocaceae cyanobacterium]